jgi:hypothetical protein
MSQNLVSSNLSKNNIRTGRNREQQVFAFIKTIDLFYCRITSAIFLPVQNCVDSFQRKDALLFVKLVWLKNSLTTIGLYYKHITIVNYDSSVVNKFGASLTDDARVVIYDCHMFIVQATGANVMRLFIVVINVCNKQQFLCLGGFFSLVFL